MIKNGRKYHWAAFTPLSWQVLLVIFFFIKLKTYIIQRTNGTYQEDPLEWQGFFAVAGECSLILSSISALFIKNKCLKWISVITGLLALYVIDNNINRFNPF